VRPHVAAIRRLVKKGTIIVRLLSPEGRVRTRSRRTTTVRISAMMLWLSQKAIQRESKRNAYGEYYAEKGQKVLQFQAHTLKVVRLGIVR
jgi:hypothetical protein